MSIKARAKPGTCSTKLLTTASALVWALERGDTPPEALRWGVAAGAAALLSPGTALAQAADIHRLHAQVPVPQVITVAR